MTAHLPMAFAFAALLAIVHFFGEEIDEKAYPHRPFIASFATGITVAYIFLQLLPELHRGVDYFGHHAFLFGLAGFSVMHVVEKYIYHHEKDADSLKKEFKELHSAFLFIYHFALGIIIEFLLGNRFIDGVLFFAPVLFHTAISSLSIRELDEDILESLPIRIGVSLSVPLGVIISSFLHIGLFHFHSIIGIVTGMFMYVVLRDTLKPARKGEPWSFLAGVLLYSVIIMLTWAIA